LVQILEDKEESEAGYNIRLLEAETAMENGIIFDEHWYKIPITTRAMMIGSRLGRLWINNLAEEEAVRNARNK